MNCAVIAMPRLLDFPVGVGCGYPLFAQRVGRNIYFGTSVTPQDILGTSVFEVTV